MRNKEDGEQDYRNTESKESKSSDTGGQWRGLLDTLAGIWSVCTYMREHDLITGKNYQKIIGRTIPVSHLRTKNNLWSHQPKQKDLIIYGTSSRIIWRMLP